MIPAADSLTGYLPQGVHIAPWHEIAPRFSGNGHRFRLVDGLLAALQNLAGAGCRSVLLDGSFVSQKELPEDYDGAWDIQGVDPYRLDPVLLDFSNGRAAMKSKYLGELFPATALAAPGLLYRDFFMKDRNGVPKGVVNIDLGEPAMITNERQYRITRSEADRFRKAIGELAKGPARADVHPRLLQAEREAMESQLADLQTEIAEYDRLKSADISVISIGSFDELAEGLIKARIAGGLSQKALAERLSLKEQQIQRYESERYASASYQRLREIAVALGVRIKNDILLPVVPDGFGGLVSKLRQVGLDREFLLTRLLPSADAARASGEVGSDDDDYALTAKAGAVLERVFGWTQDNVFGAQALVAPRFAAAEARFKMPANRSRAATSLYSAYANYLAVVALKGARSLPKAEIPTDAAAMHRYVLKSYKTVDLKSALHAAWDLGVVVLPLRDRGTFHGACWRYEGRNAVVLKQTSRHEARWLFDLLHELFHAGQLPEAETLEVIEADETSSGRRDSAEEIAASQFAGEVVLDGKAETLAQACVQAAHNSVERLKSIVPTIAARNSVSVGALANYLAFRLSWQGVNWWGAAANLQTDDGDPWTIARDVFVERFPYDIDNELDRQLLDRALH